MWLLSRLRQLSWQVCSPDKSQSNLQWLSSTIAICFCQNLVVPIFLPCFQKVWPLLHFPCLTGHASNLPGLFFLFNTMQWQGITPWSVAVRYRHLYKQVYHLKGWGSAYSSWIDLKLWYILAERFSQNNKARMGRCIVTIRLLVY